MIEQSSIDINKCKNPMYPTINIKSYQVKNAMGNFLCSNDASPIMWTQCRNGYYPDFVVTSTDNDIFKRLVARSVINDEFTLPAHLQTDSPYTGACYVVMTNIKTVVSSYEVLVGPKDFFYWVSSSDGQFVANAIVCGRLNTGEQLYMGRVEYEGQQIPGTIVQSRGCCYILHQGNQLLSRDYDILVS